MSSQSVVIIPARYGSTRFPGKPLTMVRGKMMIQRVWEIAAQAVGRNDVYIATDDTRIVDTAAKFGAKAVMTPVECQNGSERVHAAIEHLGISPEVIINFQGDALLTPPWFIEELVRVMVDDRKIEYATPAVQIGAAQYAQILESKKVNPLSGAFVTFDLNGDALYFSKQVIPTLRSNATDPLPLYKHIGMYAYRPESLARYVKLAPTMLECVEGLEQLRLLEHGLSMRVVCVDFRGRSAWAIDAPEDVRMVEEIIDREGELVGS